ncbi:MAG: DNA repair exonuclease [Deltaproteobacteria bacterium]|nr:DNA repair exonuclease [Deltaproteobacteria bacterium]
MAITFIHTADIHLDSHFRSLGDYAETRQKDFLATFSKICQVAIEKKADFLVIAGDLFDSPHPSQACFGRVQAELEKVFANDTQVILIPGTHDNIMASDHVYRHPFWKSTVLFKDPILKDPIHIQRKNEHVYFYGIAYLPEQVTPYLSHLKRRSSEGIHIGLLHGSVQNAPNWKIYGKDFPITEEQIFSLGLDYLALGHYHNALIYEEQGRIRASYPGTPEGKRFKEQGDRFVHWIEISSGAAAKVTLSQVPVNSKTLIDVEVDLSLLSQEEQLLKEIQKKGGASILARLTLRGLWEEVLDIEKIAGACAPYFAYLELIDETTVVDSQWIMRLEQENSIRGFFIRKMKEKIGTMTDPEEQEIYQAAFKEILTEFQKIAQS